MDSLYVYIDNLTIMKDQRIKVRRLTWINTDFWNNTSINP